MNLKSIPTLGNLQNTIISDGWFVSQAPVPYKLALSIMENYVQHVIECNAPETVWLLEHPAIYTGGTSAKENDILIHTIPYYKTNRGGQVTYHGPGQLIAYVIIDLKKRDLDIRAYVNALESWLQKTFAYFDVQTFTDKTRVGIWVQDQMINKKIAAIGVRITRGITWHGVSINLTVDLSKYKAIVPCGIKDAGVTSLNLLNRNVTKDQFILHLQKEFEKNNFLRFR